MPQWLHAVPQLFQLVSTPEELAKDPIASAFSRESSEEAQC